MCNCNEHVNFFLNCFVFSSEVDSSNEAVENVINMTCVFPDASRPRPTNGGFENQDEFRQFMMDTQDGSWNCELHARPLAEKIEDYKDDALAKAFPLLFPYGYSGLNGDKALLARERKTGKMIKRAKKDVLRKYLQHGKPNFHTPLFNLIVENLIMKEKVFDKSRMFCNVRQSEYSAMGEKYGTMTGQQLERAINNVQYNLPSQHSSAAENQFLKSIQAACADLPHSNEASMTARKIYFSYLMRFGIPAIFLTVTPDDLRNFRIILYSLKEVKAFGTYNVEDMQDEDIIAEYTLRSNARSQYPGLCAEEYDRIIELVIKHLFNWNAAKQESNGPGIFAEVLAWCLANEEQGRKSLHGHFLLFLKNWKEYCDKIQLGKANADCTTGFHKAKNTIVQFHSSICSPRLFSDFEPYKPMEQVPVFFHEDCCGKRKQDKMQYTVQPVDSQHIRNMRNKKYCFELQGQIATCQRCDKIFSNDEVITNALNVHLGKGNSLFGYPESKTDVKRLDWYVYECQKDFEWYKKSDYEKALRYFACNVQSNAHFVNHATRCFKKGLECFANLPDSPCEFTEILFNDEFDDWYDWKGMNKRRSMFSIRPKRNIEDCFGNTHSPFLTSILGCNTNVLCGLTGPIVMYVTGYSVKSQQKEEREAFENVSKVLYRTIQNQVNVHCFCPRLVFIALLTVLRCRNQRIYPPICWVSSVFLQAFMPIPVRILSQLRWRIISQNTNRVFVFRTTIISFPYMECIRSYSTKRWFNDFAKWEIKPFHFTMLIIICIVQLHLKIIVCTNISCQFEIRQNHLRKRKARNILSFWKGIPLCEILFRFIGSSIVFQFSPGLGSGVQVDLIPQCYPLLR